MEICSICGKPLKNKSGLAGHMMLAHGDRGAEQIRKVEKTIERKSVTETLAGNLPRVKGQIRAKKESIEGVQPEEKYYEEDFRRIQLEHEREELEREKRELQNRLMQYEEPPEIKRLRSEIEDIRERFYHSNEEKGINEESGETSEMSPPAFPPLPPLLPIPPPPFAETLSEKIKKMSERVLFR